MIRKIIFSILVLMEISLQLQAQHTLLYGIFPVKKGRIIYEKVVPVDSANKDELFKRSQLWASNAYKTQKDTNQTEDKILGSLIYKRYLTVLFPEPVSKVAVEWNCLHTIKIFCKDNAATITITDLEQRAPSGYGTITSVRMEALKRKTDSLPKSVFFGKNSRANYWKSELLTLREIDNKIKTLITSFEKSLKDDKP